MAWISYGQNGEDVRLRRAFADKANGFYIDVGANDPTKFSVTRHFYDKGWSGVNVEPLRTKFEDLSRARPRDVTLNVGCSNRAGTLELFASNTDMSGLSTFTPEEAEVHERNGVTFEKTTVPTMTLAGICEAHVKGRDIDFLSVDVEGHERAVLEGADFRRFRPRVILVEATRPNTQIPTHQLWEDLILANDYTFVVFDGLNRFYVRNEDLALSALLVTPPNVFDDYTPYEHHLKIRELEAALLGNFSFSLLARAVVNRVRSAISKS